jgi:hypothetical protein
VKRPAWNRNGDYRLRRFPSSRVTCLTEEGQQDRVVGV